jgi:hypothetical protein
MAELEGKEPPIKKTPTMAELIERYPYLKYTHHGRVGRKDALI